MKKSILFFLLLGMTFFTSCETQETVLTEQNKTTSIYNTAIVDYFNNYKASLSNNKERTKKISALMAAIDYNNIKYFDLKTTEKLLVADLKEFNFTQNATNNKLILFVNDNKIARARLVNFESQDPFNQYDDLILSILNMDKTKLNYTGRVNQFDIIQNKEFSNVFSEGKLIENGATKNKVLNSIAAKGDCIDWYWVTTYSNGSQTEEYLYTTCDPCDALLDKSANCGGGGSSGASNGASPSFPPNPYDKQPYSFTSPDGVYTEYRYNEQTNNWDIVINNLPDVVVRSNPTKYPKLVIIWPFHNQKVVSDGLIYTYDASGTGNWEGVLADDVILDHSFQNNPCLMEIYSKLGGSKTFQNFLNNFDNNMSVLDLKISIDTEFQRNQDPIHWKAQAITLMPINNTIEIIFNNDLNLDGRITNFPQLSIATNLIHEVIHAEINRELATASTNNNINPQQMSDSEWKSFLNNIKDDFAEMFKYYSKYVLNTKQPSDFQHQYMADKYRGVIIEALKQYDNNSHSDDYYDALAWNGLKKTVAWDRLTPDQKTKILETIQTIYKNEKYCN